MKDKVADLLKNDLFPIIAGVALFIPAFVFGKTGMTAVSIILYVAALCVSGIRVFADAVRGIARKDLLDEKFLMCVAAVGAFATGEYAEGVAVMLFFQIGEYFQRKAVAHSRASIRSLMDIRPDEACVLRDGREELADADDVEIGETLILRPGDRVPLDCVVTEGTADVDTSALTGESVPRSAFPGTEIDSGSLVMGGTLRCRTLRSADSSAAARILESVENASENKAKEEAFITKFAHWYTPAVVFTAVALAVIPPLLFGREFTDYLHRALIFLVVSCPCALVISVPMAFFGGIGGAASKGILFKGGNVFAPLSKAGIFAFDKTGTLTAGKFRVAGVKAEGMSERELLRLAAGAEYGSTHPLAVCLKNAVPDAPKPDVTTVLPGFGVTATVEGHRIAVGNLALMEKEGVCVRRDESENGILFVACDGRYAGSIAVEDKIKEGTEEIFAGLRSLGVKKNVMLSGDRRETAEKVATELGMDEVRAELKPEDKFALLKEWMENGETVAYVGDGINDSPSLAGADVGIAMGGIGTDSAIEAADLVIMSDDLNCLPKAVRIARKTLWIAKENIIFALGVKLAVLLLGAMGIPGMMWWAVFADVGVAVIAILNAMRTLHGE